MQNTNKVPYWNHDDATFHSFGDNYMTYVVAEPNPDNGDNNTVLVYHGDGRHELIMDGLCDRDAIDYSYELTDLPVIPLRLGNGKCNLFDKNTQKLVFEDTLECNIDKFRYMDNNHLMISCGGFYLVYDIKNGGILTKDGTVLERGKKIPIDGYIQLEHDGWIEDIWHGKVIPAHDGDVLYYTSDNQFVRIDAFDGKFGKIEKKDWGGCEILVIHNSENNNYYQGIYAHVPHFVKGDITEFINITDGEWAYKTDDSDGYYLFETIDDRCLFIKLEWHNKPKIIKSYKAGTLRYNIFVGYDDETEKVFAQEPIVVGKYDPYFKEDPDKWLLYWDHSRGIAIAVKYDSKDGEFHYAFKEPAKIIVNDLRLKALDVCGSIVIFYDNYNTESPQLLEIEGEPLLFDECKKIFRDTYALKRNGKCYVCCFSSNPYNQLKFSYLDVFSTETNVVIVKTEDSDVAVWRGAEEPIPIDNIYDTPFDEHCIIQKDGKYNLIRTILTDNTYIIFNNWYDDIYISRPDEIIIEKDHKYRRYNMILNRNTTEWSDKP